MNSVDDILQLDGPWSPDYLRCCIFPFFSSSPHCNHTRCGMCSLYADTTASDAMRIANAAKKAAKSVLKTEGVSVDVASIMKGPPPMKRRC